MNLIVCGEKCRHQKDGYCCLEGGSQVTSSRAHSCWHFEKPQEPEMKSAEGVNSVDTN